MTNNNKNILLEIKNLKKYYEVKGGFFDKAKGVVRAVDGIGLKLNKATVYGLVGESGCGKTTVGRLILRVVDSTDGQIILYDEKSHVDLCKITKSKLRPLRRKIQMVFQDPFTSLDPRMTCQQIIGEPLRALKSVIDKNEYKERISACIKDVGLSIDYLNRYPHELSGGQRQRIGIARALMTNPNLIVADEPVSALDVSVQAQILNLLKDLQETHQLAYLFISHDLAVIRHMCDKVAVMYVGKIIETSDCDSIFESPGHPYTEALLSIVPKPGNIGKKDKHALKGQVADASDLPSGCYFHPRCRYAKKICHNIYPELREIAPGHYSACHFDLNLKGI